MRARPRVSDQENTTKLKLATATSTWTRSSHFKSAEPRCGLPARNASVPPLTRISTSNRITAANRTPRSVVSKIAVLGILPTPGEPNRPQEQERCQNNGDDHDIHQQIAPRSLGIQAAYAFYSPRLH